MHGCGMRYIFLWFVAVVSCFGQDAVTEVAPPAVVKSATEAVEELGKEVVMGRYQVAVERMYPQWKERTAKRMGGMEALEKRLAGVAKEMLKQGISVTNFKPFGVARAYEVGPGKVVMEENGQRVEKLRYTKWMVLVPTVTTFRTILKDDPLPVIIESEGFQVAVADKGQANWTFIDGSSISVNDLRSLFVNLPKDLELPQLEKRRVN